MCLATEHRLHSASSPLSSPIGKRIHRTAQHPLMLPLALRAENIMNISSTRCLEHAGHRVLAMIYATVTFIIYHAVAMVAPQEGHPFSDVNGHNRAVAVPMEAPRKNLL